MVHPRNLFRDSKVTLMMARILSKETYAKSLTKLLLKL